MSSHESESLSEREFANELEGQIGELFGVGPRSPSEAARATEEPAGEPEVEEVVYDEPPKGPEAPPASPEEIPSEPEEETPGEGEPEEESLAWAKRKYGDDVNLEKLAKVAWDQEQTVSRLGAKARENEDLAGQWYQYSQNLEAQLQRQPTGMPISSAEENWVEQSLQNPLQYALQAKMQGNEQLYRAVVNRVAQEDPVAAGQVSAYVEMTAAEQLRAQQQGNGAEPPSAEQTIQASIARLGIDLGRYGQPMMAKVGELGEYHPYTQAILSGSDQERDLAFQAIYDLVREGKVTRKVVRDEEREDQIRREGELRRKAAGVLTGAPRTAPAKQSAFMDEMENEWRRRGQWRDE